MDAAINKQSSCARCLGLAVVTLAMGVPSFGQERGLVRWAVVATPEAARDGLAELVFLKLSKDTGLELVERARLEHAMRELELATLLSAEDCRQRLKLGQVAGADALLLLSLEARDERQLLKITASDCRFGARLRLAYRPYQPADVPETAVFCAALVKEVRDHFTEGISQIVGVPPFLSKNLTHGYDGMQLGYARLLEEALLAVPGVAVLEFEEARAIQRELDATGRTVEERAVILIVEGDYEMEQQAPREPLYVNLSLRLSKGDGTQRAVVHRRVPYDDVPGLLVDELPNDIVQGETARPAIDRQRQFEIIARRANEFGDLGLWERSIEIREAALLLKPGHAQQRLLLLVERQDLAERRRIPERNQLTAGQRNGRSLSELWSELRERRRVDWWIRMQHVEYLIRNRLVNPREASYLAARTIGYRERLRPEDEDLDLADDFFWRMFRLIPQLDYSVASGEVRGGLERSYDLINLRPEIWSRPGQMKYWIAQGYKLLVDGRRFVRPSLARDNPDQAEQLTGQRVRDDIYRFFMEIVPKEGAPFWLTLWQSEYRKEEYRELYQRLTASEHPGARVYGRYRLLQMAFADKDREPDQELLDEADSLLKHVDASDSAVLRDYHEPVRGIRVQIAGRLARMTGPVGKRYAMESLDPFQFDTLGRVGFARTDLVSDDWKSIERCTDSLDLIYTDADVYVIREPGKVETIWTANDEHRFYKHLYVARWDGRNIWVATAVGGVQVFSPDGRLITRFDAESGLPHYRQSLEREPTDYLLLHPLEPGRCLAIGALGRQERAWFAVLDANPKAARRIHLFHRLDKSSGQLDDPELIAEISWVKPYQLAGEPPKLLVKRHRRERPPYPVTVPTHPLIIDPRTLDVAAHTAAFDLPLGGPGNQTARQFSILPDGTVLHPVGFGVERFTFHQGRDWRDPVRMFLQVNFHGSNAWLEQEERILFAGGDWYQIDKRELRADRLTNGPVPYHCQFDHYGLSAHYGMVAWDRRGPLTRVLIDVANPPVDPLAAYRWVPDADRRQHARAADRLTQLGALVGPTICNANPPDGDRYWTMERIKQGLVCLPQTWRGGRDDLRLLPDLHELTELEFRRAGLTNQQLAGLPRLEKLKKLTLYDTSVTDEGLALLSADRLPNLEYLRIEPKVDRYDLTNKGLGHVVRLPTLKELTLYGPGFTDAGLDTLTRLPRGCRLQLNGTRFTREGLAAFRKKRPDVSCSGQ